MAERTSLSIGIEVRKYKTQSAKREYLSGVVAWRALNDRSKNLNILLEALRSH